MKKLTQYNIEASNHLKAGVLCDKCGVEMIYDMDYFEYLSTLPHSKVSSKVVKCISCGYIGEKIEKSRIGFVLSPYGKNS